ncbi:actin nucleation-promoting factor WAS [Lepeophtheirus salmonis]|uniref:actin nucleation-promoting factor WAS n=1 Tax=Lepeophtheirus salmonis TaxID=72036 RepID=UPI001AE5AFFA|nr:neural Wiskott-Aldrich syndrome protein-like [Lepeophtheirus salmonis]
MSGSEAERGTLGHASHRSSKLLTHEENVFLMRLLGPRCPSLATSVVQVFESRKDRIWSPVLRCGVVCFVKDNLKRSYYIRILHLPASTLALNQEIYSQFCYKTPMSWFHTFEGDSAVIGLNFANEIEALQFKNILQTNLRERRLHKERKNAQKRSLGSGHLVRKDASESTSFSTSSLSSSIADMSINTVGSSSGLSTNSQHHSFVSGGYKLRNLSRKKIKKEDISRPTNFKHISHVGWDPNKGFDLENVDPKLLKFFSRAGVSEKELKNKRMRDFIYQFIDDHGGFEAAIQEVDHQVDNDHILQHSLLFKINPYNKHAPSPPNTSNTYQHQAPAPPPRQSSIGRPLVKESLPPAPSRINVMPQRDKNPSSLYWSNKASMSVPSQFQNVNTSSLALKKETPPTLPPIPIPLQAPTPPPPPGILFESTKIKCPLWTIEKEIILNSDQNTHNCARNNLMEEIRKGGNLRHVTSKEIIKPSKNMRNDLMDQIRTGVTLKKVDFEQNNEFKEASGIAGLLQKALKERLSAVGFSSSEGEEADDEDEWDD